MAEKLTPNPTGGNEPEQMNEPTHVLVFRDCINRVTLKEHDFGGYTPEGRQNVYMHGQHIGSIKGPYSGVYQFTNWPNPEAPRTIHLLPIDGTPTGVFTTVWGNGQYYYCPQPNCGELVDISTDQYGIEPNCACTHTACGVVE